VAHQKLKARADYIPANYGDDFSIKGITNKIVYLIDFSLPSADIKKLQKQGNQVIAIDHHVSSAESVKSADRSLYDIKHSGAMLAWFYFFPTKPVPTLIKYIEDQDLWNFKLPQTQPLTMYINTIDFDFKLWNKLAKDLKNTTTKKKLIATGQSLLKYRDRLIDRSVEHKLYFVKFEDYTVPVINLSSKSITSKLGQVLYEKYPPLAIVWSETGTIRNFSIRGNGKVDVAKMAEKFGGGGHHNAAGFSLPANKPFPWKLIKE